MSINGFGPVALVYPDNSPVSNEPVSVRSNETGLLAPLFTSTGGGVSLPNPLSTDPSGMLSFFAEEGSYEIEILSSGFKMTVVVYPPLAGAASDLGEVKIQAAPSASWYFAHGLGRLPAVAVFLDSGEEVEADTTVSATEVTVVWPFPVSGKLVLA